MNKEEEDSMDILSYLARTNDTGYNLLKTVEECSELSELLMKRYLKGTESNEHIIEEIGDVLIRLLILTEVFGADKVGDRIEEKLEKYKTYIKEKKYIGKI